MFRIFLLCLKEELLHFKHLLFQWVRHCTYPIKSIKLKRKMYFFLSIPPIYYLMKTSDFLLVLRTRKKSDANIFGIQLKKVNILYIDICMKWHYNQDLTVSLKLICESFPFIFFLSVLAPTKWLLKAA